MWRTACLPLHEWLVFDGTCGEIYQSYDPMGNRIVSKNTRRGSPHRCFGFTNCVKEAMFRRYVQLNISLSNTTHTQNRNHHLQTKQVRFSLVCKNKTTGILGIQWGFDFQISSDSQLELFTSTNHHFQCRFWVTGMQASLDEKGPFCFGSRI